MKAIVAVTMLVMLIATPAFGQANSLPKWFHFAEEMRIQHELEKKMADFENLLDELEGRINWQLENSLDRLEQGRITYDQYLDARLGLLAAAEAKLREIQQLCAANRKVLKRMPVLWRRDWDEKFAKNQQRLKALQKVRPKNEHRILANALVKQYYLSPLPGRATGP